MFFHSNDTATFLKFHVKTKVKFNCTYTMSLDEKSGEVKCGIQRQNKQKTEKNMCYRHFFFNGSQNICDDIDFTMFFPVSS